MLQALDNVDLDLMWPADPAQHQAARSIGRDLDWRFEGVSSDPDQCFAVREFVGRRTYAPFLLRGAFGTGKTTCVCEAILQVVRHQPASRVLVCCESNNAADLVVQKLADYMTPDALLRLYAMHRSVTTVPESMLPFASNYDTESQTFPIPSPRELFQRRVVVSTYGNASVLYGIGMPIGRDGFSHVVLDEVAQTMEPMAAIPLTLCDKTSVILMSGDEAQLAPKVHSQQARCHGLGESILDRLLKTARAVYSAEQNNSHVVTLKRNYRSHPALLDLPSQMFYHSQLVPCVELKRVDRLSRWKELPAPGFPMCFIGVEGAEEQEHDSPSFFNRDEAREIRVLVHKLVSDPDLGVHHHDVAVIAPFAKQVQLIRRELRTVGCSSITVGGIEVLQGREFMAVFVSTVRSSERWLGDDDRHSIGILRDPKRLNTALTRARGLLAVFGDPYVLSSDKDWKKVIAYCQKNGAYDGPELSTEYITTRQSADADGDHIEESEIDEAPSLETTTAGSTVTRPPPAHMLHKFKSDPWSSFMLCKRMVGQGSCFHGSNCFFPHSEEELDDWTRVCRAATEPEPAKDEIVQQVPTGLDFPSLGQAPSRTASKPLRGAWGKPNTLEQPAKELQHTAPCLCKPAPPEAACKDLTQEELGWLEKELDELNDLVLAEESDQATDSKPRDPWRAAPVSDLVARPSRQHNQVHKGYPSNATALTPVDSVMQRQAHFLKVAKTQGLVPLQLYGDPATMASWPLVFHEPTQSLLPTVVAAGQGTWSIEICTFGHTVASIEKRWPEMRLQFRPSPASIATQNERAETILFESSAIAFGTQQPQFQRCTFHILAPHSTSDSFSIIEDPHRFLLLVQGKIRSPNSQ
eukprot:TRINITY_DN9987_c0_g1_i3.p1 TRINITY_DN9987_c0_g1~~TRINITY_DN9987_c0_g1_i3.p1  ORF type:complete len:864 (+),score=133.10 TRINITY_DN9987_c0_g1_i3:1590-4181(+)